MAEGGRRHDEHYVFSDEQGYHLVYYERGMEGLHRISKELLDILFWTLHLSIRDMASSYELENRDLEYKTKKLILVG